MKIAITTAGDTLQSQVDPRFGRALKFVIYNTDNNTHEIFDNHQDLNAVHGAGIQAAENVVRNGADALITGNCGPNAYRVLSAAGVSVYTGFSGTVFEAINALQKGELNKSEAANVQGHW